MPTLVAYRAPGELEVVTRPTPSPARSDAVLKVLACGVCGSDVTSYYEGKYVSPGQVMGHEFVGVVTARGEECPLAVGDRVMVRPMRSCGGCWYCLRGDIHLCARTGELSLSYGLPGGYAEEVLVPDCRPGENVHLLAEGVDPNDALWAEPLAVAVHAVDRAGPLDGARVAVLGAGSIGLCLLAAARAAGARVDVVEPRAARAALARRFGAGTVLPEAAGLAPVDVLLDSSGVPAAVAAAVPALLPPGPAVLVGVTAGAVQVPGGVEVRGAFGYRAADFARAADLINSGAVRLGGAVTHEYGLPDLAEAMRTVRHDPRAGKVVIKP